MTLRRRTFLAGAAGLSPFVLAACATGGAPAPQAPKVSSTNGDAKNPFGVDPKAPLDVVIFKGGFSDDYAKFHESMYKKRYPEASVKHTGIQDVATQMQPRFVGGNPPDVLDNSGMPVPVATLASQGQLTDLAPLLAAPAWDTEGKTVGDTLLAGATSTLTFEGKALGINYAYNLGGIWYNGKLFREKGWEYPETWDGLMALGAETAKASIPLWTYQGQHPGYMLGVIMPMFQKHGGNEVMKHIDNLEDGAWQQESVRLVAEAMEEIKSRKFLLPGTASLTHIQAQAAWLKHKAAIIPCGSWLKNEMKSQVPADFEMQIAPTPSLSESDKIPFAAINNGPGEDFIIPAQAKNVPGGLEFLRIMMSVEGARQFAELTHTLTVVADAHSDQTSDPIIVSSNERLQAAKQVEPLENSMYPTWYPKLYEEASAATGVLLTGNLDAKGFVDRIQKYADKVKKDPKIKKFTR
ncbi:N-acetylglucosamine/diacetylchitobiose ABC transporter substrate-binding protein [Tenggerimyces flavus]|uniref:N-acetylglucosamine/diacetylchitobiose ABC transporter substrate-binding protein n=1 Tax=Tenggerimyces flavus TaxID=1708749 RepID=A0ABV7Y403_9ACTN|nr:N-acetylglucosamine/diacetylchitobiose ABC transporter substrate-binding protein [Tenggerimyces flavus]MBM7790610.1 N-acetylglucosamine transport system substrate-binding protein [Tenggerimyces flavus]